MPVADFSTFQLSLADLAGVNAHNPTASKQELRAACFRAVLAAYNPAGFFETMLARDIARRAAQVLCDEQRLDAFAEQAEQALGAVLSPTADGVAPPVSQFPSIHFCAPDRLEVLARTEQRNSNALFLRLRQLAAAQRDRNSVQITLRDRDPRFASEVQCIAYLARRFRLGDEGCRRCGQVGAGSWIAVRRCWQCSNCNTQTCIRHGTIMERSHVVLVRWFHAIGLVLTDPKICVADLAAGIGVRRLPTVRNMLGKLHRAMLHDNANLLLAGLDKIYLL